MKFAYYPGCSLSSTAAEYDASARAVASALGVDLVEIPDWNCCGASSAHSVNHELGVALAARNIAIAETMGMDVAIPCAACYNRLACARTELLDDPSLKKLVEPLLPYAFRGSSKVRPLLEVFTGEVGLEAIKAKVTSPLKMKVACYYGCLLVRPPKSISQFDRTEDPLSLDLLMEALGAEPVDWPHKTECCGASFALTRTDIIEKMSGDVLEMALDCGAEAIVCACPLCMSNLDLRQKTIAKQRGREIDIPILYFTEALATAMGLPGVEGWFTKHFVSPAGLVSRAKAAAAAEKAKAGKTEEAPAAAV